MATNQITVKAAYDGPLFQIPDKYEITLNVERYLSQWAIRSTADNGSTAIREHGINSKKLAIEKMMSTAENITLLNQKIRKQAKP
jgi:hypothetical protein